jgi:hypothetical protein
MRVSRAAAVALPLLAGCYSTVPVDLSKHAVGRRVAVELTSAGARAVAPTLGAGVVGLEGRITRAGADSLELSLERVTLSAGGGAPWQGQRVAVARAIVARVGERRLDRRRSWAVAGGALLAAVAAGIGFGSGGTGSVPGGGGTTPPQ